MESLLQSIQTTIRFTDDFIPETLFIIIPVSVDPKILEIKVIAKNDFAQIGIRHPDNTLTRIRKTDTKTTPYRIGDGERIIVFISGLTEAGINYQSCSNSSKCFT
jgi:hypothetical protein